jgi:hypothetical protein
MPVFSDGEFRRDAWQTDLSDALDGFVEDYPGVTNIPGRSLLWRNCLGTPSPDWAMLLERPRAVLLQERHETGGNATDRADSFPYRLGV